MKLGIPVYEGVNLLDVAGPLEMFSWVDKKKKLKTLILSSGGASVTSLNGVRFDAQASFEATPVLDVLSVPGGDPRALGEIMADPESPYLVFTCGRSRSMRNGFARSAKARSCWLEPGCSMVTE
jgi:putative intracellular protease/amidase